MTTRPLLSIIIPCHPSEHGRLQGLLGDLKRQTFKDFEVIVHSELGPEQAKAMGIYEARGQILGFFCADNRVRDRDFLRTMLWYASRPEGDGAFTARYDYVQSDTLLSRYFALLGANDPLCWWLGKADRRDYLERSTRTNRVEYSSRIPSIGDNGFFLKASIAKAHLPHPDLHYCIDWIEDIRKAKGSVSFWIVQEQTLWHQTGESWWTYFQKRWRYVNDLYFDRLPRRRWVMVTRQDWPKVIAFALCSLAVLPHLWTAYRGYCRVPDRAWGLHPILCLGLTLLYTAAWLRHRWLFARGIARKIWRCA